MVPPQGALSPREQRPSATALGPSFLPPESLPVAAMAPRPRTATTVARIMIVRRCMSGRLRAGAYDETCLVLTGLGADCFRAETNGAAPRRRPRLHGRSAAVR